MTVATLSERFTARAATLADAEAVTDLENSCGIADIGHESTDLSATLAGWQSPHCNPQTNSQLVFDGEQLVGLAGFWAEPPCAVVYGWVRVHPEHKGQGVGAHLAQWLEAAARDAGLAKAPDGTRVALQQVRYDFDVDSHELLEARGYRTVRHWYWMRIELETAPPKPQFPAALNARTFDRARDLASLVRAEQEIFRDHWGHVALDFNQDLEAWGQYIDHDVHHDPTLWFLVTHEEEIVAVCLCAGFVPGEPEMGYVESLGVQRPWRLQGVGLAMLHHAFGELYRRGKTSVSLDVDAESLTGATRLYEKAGMHVARDKVAYEFVLRDGEDLTRQVLDA